MEHLPGSTEDKIYRFFSKFPARAYPKDNIIVFAGEQSPYVFYIDSGKACQYDITYRGDEVIVNIFKAGAFFSMAWVMNDAENKYFYKAELPTRVFCAPKQDVLTFLKENNDVALDLLTRIYRGVDGILTRAVFLMAGSAKERVVHELILEHRRFGHPQSDGSSTLDISEKELAARAGLARETVSRELGRLKAKSIVAVTAHGITVREPQALEAMLAAHR